MTNEELKQLLTEAFKTLEESAKVNLPYVPVATYTKAFEELGDINILDDWDSNGWDHDFWCHFFWAPTAQRYTFGGSWYSGGYFLIKEEK